MGTSTDIKRDDFRIDSVQLFDFFFFDFFSFLLFFFFSLEEEYEENE